VDGAPLCNASGDQHRIFPATSGCNVLRLGWLDSVAGTDSLTGGSVGPIPPTGECDAYPLPVDATGAIEVSTTEVLTPIIALPGYCLLPVIAEAWLQGTGAASQIVVHNDQWYQHTRVVVDDGDFPRLHVRAAPSGQANFMDTALVVVWSDERTGVPQIRAQRVNQLGGREWGASGVLIAPTGAAQRDPEIARLPDGTTLVVWSDERSGGSDVYALRLLPNGTPAPGWPATGMPLEDRTEVSASPRLVGMAVFQAPRYVVWEESGPRFAGGRSIVARRLLADGTMDPAWDPLGVPLSSSATVEHLQDVTVTYDDLVAVWTDTRAASPSNPTDLYAQWLEHSGEFEPGWPSSGLAICTATGRQDAARVSAAASYAAFAWEDHRGGDADIYAGLRFSNGTVPPGLWVANGLPATSAPGDQTAPVVGAGNAGGCFVAWVDARDIATTGLDIYAQAFNGEGEKLDVPNPGPTHGVSLGLPRPNPSRGRTVLTLQLSTESAVRVEVLDVAGRHVRTLAAGRLGSGAREISFDGRDDAGRDLPPGVYRVRARVGDAESSRTIIRIQ
jgi:hypothetical protein